MRKTKQFLTLLLAIAMIINPIFYNIEPLDNLMCNKAFASTDYQITVDATKICECMNKNNEKFYFLYNSATNVLYVQSEYAYNGTRPDTKMYYKNDVVLEDVNNTVKYTLQSVINANTEVVIMDPAINVINEGVFDGLEFKTILFRCYGTSARLLDYWWHERDLKFGKNSFKDCTNLIFVGWKSYEKYVSPGEYVVSDLSDVTIKIDKKDYDLFLHVLDLYIGESAFENCKIGFADNGTNNCQSELQLPGKFEIEENAFKNCLFIKEIYLPYAEEGYGYAKIGTGAFKNCRNITSIMLGEMVSVGESAFEDCTSLEEINSLHYSGGTIDTWTKTIEPINIGKNSFKGCKSLKEIKILGDEGIIPEGAFEGCTALETVRIGNDVSNLEKNCFANSGIVDLSIDNNTLTAIENGCFTNCKSLTNLTIWSNSIETISDFEGCDNLKFENITFAYNVEKSLKKLSYCLNKTDNTVIDLSAFKNLEEISNFNNLDTKEAITQVILPDSLKKIGDSAFEGYKNLSDINTANVESIGNNAFKDCTSISSIGISSNLYEIGSGAFENCTSLLQMNLENISSEYKVVNENTFKNCTSLGSIKLNNNITTINDNAFDGTALQCLVLDKNITNLSENSLKNGNYLIVTSSENVKSYCDNKSIKCMYLSSFDLLNSLFVNGADISIDMDNVEQYKELIAAYENCSDEQAEKLENYFKNVAVKITQIYNALTYIDNNRENLDNPNNVTIDNINSYNKTVDDYDSLNKNIKKSYNNNFENVISTIKTNVIKFNFIVKYMNIFKLKYIMISNNKNNNTDDIGILTDEKYAALIEEYNNLSESDKAYVKGFFDTIDIEKVISYMTKAEEFVANNKELLKNTENIEVTNDNKEELTSIVDSYNEIITNSNIIFENSIRTGIAYLSDLLLKEKTNISYNNVITKIVQDDETLVIDADAYDDLITLNEQYNNLSDEQKDNFKSENKNAEEVLSIAEFISNKTENYTYAELISKTKDFITIENSPEFEKVLNEYIALPVNIKLLLSDEIKDNIEQLIQRYNELNVFTVTFMDGMTILKTETVSRGKGATAPVVNDKSEYKFIGWDKEFNNITGNLTVNALWKEEPTTTEPVETTTEQKPEETTTEQKPEETTKEQTTTKPEETTTEQKPEETTTEQKPEETTTEQKPEETTKEQTTTKPGETTTEQPTTSSVEPENSIKNAVISLQYKSTTYDGTQKKPTVTVKNKNGAALKNGTDYSITYRNNINVGTASVVITGKGNYTSSVTMNFKISQASISKATAILKYISVGYSGSAKKPSVTIKLSNKTLKKNTDYKVTYSNNVNAGTASVKISGINNYKGTKTKQFTITKLNITKASVKLKYTSTVYDGKTKKPSATVKYGKKTLKFNKDYKISYKKNKTVGVASVYITGKGNYRGTKIATFKIKAQSMKKAKVKLQYSKTTYTKSAKKPKVSVTYGKNKLKANKDYVVTYSGNINVGKAKVIISGRGNYSGSITKTFSITPKSIASSDVKAILSYTSTEYNGVAKTPFVTVYDKNTSVGNSNFRCTYENNNQIGTASVKITGMGNYTGTITKNFIINPVKTDISSVNVNGTEITLKWNSVGGASGYELSFKRAADNTWQTMETVGTTQSLFATVIAGSTQYDFRVRSFSSVNGAKYYSDYSLVKSVMVTG